MKTIIYYRTIFHGTEIYAKWLAEEIGADLKKFGWFTKTDFNGYDRVIIMSAMYAGWFPAAGFIKRNWAKLNTKNIVLIYCGAAAGTEDGEKLIKSQIPAEYLKQIKQFNLLGAEPFANGEKKLLNIKRENLKPVLAALEN